MATESELTSSQVGRLVSLAEAAASGWVRGRGGRAPHAKTLQRWADPRKGCKLPGGGAAVLETVRVGRDLLTLHEWCEAFELRRARAGRRGSQPPPPDRPERSRRAGRRAAHRWLESHGYAAGAAAG